MAHELTVQQTRQIVLMRRRHPRATLLVHQKPWGIIVEARRQEHVIELTRFDWSGGVTPDAQIPLVA
jgi:hypothetical protein